MIKNLTKQIIEFGQVKRGEIGILGTELTPELAKAIKIDAQRGVFVSQVMPKSAAEKAGVKAGDVIVTMNSKALNSFVSLRANISSQPVGTKITLGMLRNGKPVTVTVTLEQSTQSQVDSWMVFTGIEDAELSNTELDGQKGVRVDNVKAGSTAEWVGLKKDDVILGVNQQPVANIGEPRKILDTKPNVLALNIAAGDTSLYLLAQ